MDWKPLPESAQYGSASELGGSNDAVNRWTDVAAPERSATSPDIAALCRWSMGDGEEDCDGACDHEVHPVTRSARGVRPVHETVIMNQT